MSSATRRRPRVDDGLERRYWRMSVIRGGCVMCKAFPLTPEERTGRHAQIRHVEGHHVLAKRHLKKRGFTDRLWDTRNGMGLCVLHHDRHESYLQRVPYELVPAGAIEFADELGLTALLEHDYPEGGAR